MADNKWDAQETLLQRYNIPTSEHEFLKVQAKGLQGTKGAARAELVSAAWNEIKSRVCSNMLEEEVKKLCHGVFIWFHENGRSRESKEKFCILKQWTVRNVVAKTHKEKLFQLIAVHSNNAVPGSTAWLKYYQPSLTEVVQSLSEEDMETADRRASEWTLYAPPKEIQAKAAAARADRYCGVWARRMHSQLGIYPVITYSYLNQHDEVVVAVHDPGKELGIPPVTTLFPEVNNVGLIPQMYVHARQELANAQSRDDHSIPAPLPLGKSRYSTQFEITIQEDGTFQLPDRAFLECEKVKGRKQLTRDIVKAAWVKAGGKAHNVPWKALAGDTDRAILPEVYLPGSTSYLDEPTNMTMAQIDSLLDYWYGRAEQGLLPLAFQCSSGVPKAKKALGPGLGSEEWFLEMELQQPEQVKKQKREGKQYIQKPTGPRSEFSKRPKIAVISRASSVHSEGGEVASADSDFEAGPKPDSSPVYVLSVHSSAGVNNNSVTGKVNGLDLEENQAAGPRSIAESIPVESLSAIAQPTSEVNLIASMNHCIIKPAPKPRAKKQSDVPSDMPAWHPLPGKNPLSNVADSAGPSRPKRSIRNDNVPAYVRRYPNLYGSSPTYSESVFDSNKID